MNRIWDVRIRRAGDLTTAYPFAAEALRFYAQLAMLQQRLASELEQAPTQVFTADSAFWKRLSLPAVLPRFSIFLSNIRKIAPAALSQSAANLLQEDSARWSSLIEEFWHSPSTITDVMLQKDASVTSQYLTWLFLQPFAEYVASQPKQIISDGNARRCPLCGGAPIVGVLRPEGDSARKSLVCMLCAHEWAFRRIYCPACGEERESHMAFYSAPEIAHIRVDVCETCRSYTKSVDLSKFGLAVPVVDELAALPLDLWARENGYQKLQINAVGI